MGFRDLLERVGPENLLLQPPFRDPGEDFVGTRAELAAVRNVVVEAGARQEKRFAKQKLARIDRRNEPACFAVEHEHPARTQRIHAARIGVEPDRVIDHVDAAAAGDALRRRRQNLLPRR